MTSTSERSRQEKKHQVTERRASIIENAQMLFLEKGLEKTSMQDIADKAGISKVTLYRYFPDRHPIAFEVSVRMLEQIFNTASKNIPPELEGLPAMQVAFQNMVREFYTLRNAYRYIGMFDNLYAREYPTEELAEWYKQSNHRLAIDFAFSVSKSKIDENSLDSLFTIANTVMSFLEKMAARGDLMCEEQEVPLDRQLKIFETFITQTFTTLISGVSHV